MNVVNSANWGEISGSFDDYLAFGAMSSSRIKLALESWNHVFYYTSKPQTDFMKLGTAMHCAILEPEVFAQTYCAYSKPMPQNNMNKAENRAAWRAIENSGLIPIHQCEMDNIFWVQEVLQQIPITRKLLYTTKGHAEKGYWFRHECGLLCKFRPDFHFISPKSGNVVPVDLKKAKDPDPQGFMRAIGNYAYQVQDAMYRIGLQQIYPDRKISPMTWIAIDVDNPHPGNIGVYRLEEWQSDDWVTWCNAALCRYQEIVEMMQEREPAPLELGGYIDPNENGGIKELCLPDYIHQKVHRL